MADKTPEADPQSAGRPTADLDRPLTEMTVDELMALKTDYAARGMCIGNSAYAQMVMIAATGVSSAVAVSYAKAFMEILAKHNAETLIKYVRTRVRGKGQSAEVLVGLNGDAAATLIAPQENSDEARLAILDLDLTNEELRGKVLQWDLEIRAWRPDSTEDAAGKTAKGE